MGLHRFPAVRKPQLRTRVPAVVYERKVFAASCQAYGEAERTQEYFVPRAFIVKVKRFAFSADLIKAFRIELRLLLRCAVGRRRRGGGLIRGMERIAPESVLDIGDEQFLVLLLMVQAKRHQLLHLGSHGAGLKQLKHVLIDMGAIFADLFQRRARESVAQRLFRLLSHGVVIGVKKIAKLRMERLVSGQVRRKNECLKKPAGMG